MSAVHSNGAATNGRSTKYSLTALNRWSIASKTLPVVEKIKSLHVYDFDNTLFNSPLPNPKLWNGPTIGKLQSQGEFATGGWWHDSRILAATGEGIDVEEPRAWAGWWNEQIVQLIHLSMEQKDVCTVLLTGRSEEGYSELLKKMVGSKGLEFDMICLKPVAGPNNERISSTMNFKQVFLETLVESYGDAEDIRIYEDRIKHTRDFREFFRSYNTRQLGDMRTRGPITAEVVEVADGFTQLDPVVEATWIQRVVNDHNLAVSQGKRGNFKPKPLQIKKTVFYTGYLINNVDTQKLLTLAQIPSTMPDSELKFLANNILITPRPCPNSILEKVGGMGSKTTWEVTGTAVFENKIWAACVRPIPETKKYFTDNPSPVVVLALRKGARPIDAGKIQNWQPIPADKQYVFESTVGEKVLLRIEEEDPNETAYESQFPNKTHKRKHEPDDGSNRTGNPVQAYNHTSRGGHQNNNRSGRGNNHNNNRNHNDNSFRGNNSRGNNRGGGGGRGGNRGRGRGGGGHGYRSLDDVGEQLPNFTPTYNPLVAYDDFPPLQKNYQTPQQLVQQQFQQYQELQQQAQGKNGKGGNAGTGELHY